MRKIGFLVMLTLIAGSLRAQLREFRVSPFPDAPSSTIVQANTSFPDNAIIFVYTSLPDLNFRSSMNGVNQVTWNPVANRYQILVNPIRQILFVFGKDFIESSMGVISPQSKEVLSFRVEEKLAFRNEEKGTLSITSSPSGAMVTINGIETAYRTPLTREFNSGDLTISLGLPGYLPTDTIIRLTAGGRSAIFLRMRPSWAELSLEVQPAEAVVMVNGQRRWPAAGTGRIEWSGPEDGLRPGTYEIVASLDKHRSVNRMITLSAGDRRNLSLTLEPITGSLSIGSDPSGAEVWINGRREGVTPFERRLPVGEYRVSVRKEGHKDHEQSLTLRENSTERIAAELPNYSMILKPLQVKAGLAFVAGIAGLSAGGYFLYTGNSDYRAYQHATTNADDLRKRVQFADRMYPIAFAAGGTAILTSMILRSKARKFKRSWGLAFDPLPGGGDLTFTYRFGSSYETLLNR